MKKCPYCAEKIKDEAIKCRYCGSDLEQKTNDKNNEDFNKIEGNVETQDNSQFSEIEKPLQNVHKTKRVNPYALFSLFFGLLGFIGSFPQINKFLEPDFSISGIFVYCPPFLLIILYLLMADFPIVLSFVFMFISLKVIKQDKHQSGCLITVFALLIQVINLIMLLWSLFFAH